MFCVSPLSAPAAPVILTVPLALVKFLVNEDHVSPGVPVKETLAALLKFTLALVLSTKAIVKVVSFTKKGLVALYPF